MEWVSRENLAAVDRMLAQPDPAATLRIRMLGKDQARLLLRYQAAEQNRFYYENWEIVQMVLAAVFFFFLLFGTGEGKTPLVLALLLLVAVLLQRFLLTPELNGLGKQLDFGSPVTVATERARFRMTHVGYTVTEIAKWSIQVILAGVLIGKSRSRRREAGA